MKNDASESYELFVLEEPKNFDLWGDYGAVLLNGIATNRDDEAEIGLARTGPFVPPIFFPLMSRSVVVTDSCCFSLKQLGLTGMGSFREVVLEKAVLVRWQEWGRSERLEGDKLPFNGEPEEYLYHNTHSPEVASSIGKLWVWNPEIVGRVERIEKRLRLRDLRETQCEVFRLNDKGWRSIFVSDRGRKLLLPVLGEWVTFSPVEEEVVD